MRLNLSNHSNKIFKSNKTNPTKESTYDKMNMVKLYDGPSANEKTCDLSVIAFGLDMI